ncbi:hypothetical protein [Anaerococcus senegalensis]|uniref:hypothetical protein n=1 Tax=Anaerococcus senegalensis TaxID=1288120 RepID=UPI0003199F78|nr:hypothetical protein [Anaerococcus senegalensis]
MKSKLLSILLAASFILTACGQDKNATETKEEPSKEVEQTQSVESNKEESSEEEIQEEKKEEETATNEQEIQAEPGNTQEKNYFNWETNNAIYKQTGDAFITNSKYDDSKILVIPINFTNKQEEASDPWMTFVLDYKVFQEDENQEYTLNGGQGQVPDEYDSPLNTSVKKDGNTDWYITYTLEKPESDVRLQTQFGSGVDYTFKQK